jgi:hypothetical protein
MIIDRNEKDIVLKENDSIIEKYNFEKEINFQELVNFLLNKNLSEKIIITDNIDKKDEKEENLIKLITGIIEDYNNKVDDYNQFVKETDSE